MTEMSTATSTENVFTSQFSELIAVETDKQMAELRRAAFSTLSESGFPTLRDEDWKYTNVAPIVKGSWRVVNGQIGELAPDEIDALRRFDHERNGFTALNLAFADVLIIRIDAETSVDVPIALNFAADEGTAIFPHVVIFAGRGSRATVIEAYDSTARSFTNAAVQIFVEENANLTHYRVQKDSTEAFNYGVTEVTVATGASYDSTNINLGGAISRHDIDLRFTAESGEARVDGLYMLSGSQHHDTHSNIDHALPNCRSHQTYKGVLDGSSRGVFNGKVFVRENASGTDAQQSNKNLLLSNDARVDTKPQLEIFNDDVKCSHGATVGQLEDEELFYLLTRGLPETLARNLLTYGFAEEIINKIEIDEIKADLDAIVLNRLGTEI